jgi:hypothetical protein
MKTLIDLNPKGQARLPRGVHPCREYQVFDHERELWIRYQEFLYETALGSAHIVVAPGRNLQEGIAVADRLLKEDSATAILEPAIYGTVNSIRNHADLCSGAPLTLALARSGAYTERSVGRILEVFTGGGKIQPSRLHRIMADRPALTFPYQPFAEHSYRRIKPGCTPPEVKLKYATPFGTSRNELFLTGKIINRWSDPFYRSVLADVNYDLWITEGEKKAMCLALLPLLLGLKMDVVGIPGVWMWGRKQGPDHWKLAPELEAYCFKAPDGARRRVGILFDQDSWRNHKVADALLRLCKVLREAGALVFVGVIPPGSKQKGIDDFFAKHCVHGNVLDFAPLLDLMNRSVYVDQDYAVSYPSPEVSCRLRSLAEQAEAFCETQEKFKDRAFAESPSEAVDKLVLELGSLLSADENGGTRYLEEFRSLRPENQGLRWAEWMAHNPFQTELDRQLDPFIPGVFRGQAAMDPRLSFEQVEKNRLPPEVLRELNHF